jgi:hypothetical protein
MNPSVVIDRHARGATAWSWISSPTGDIGGDATACRLLIHFV